MRHSRLVLGGIVIFLAGFVIGVFVGMAPPRPAGDTVALAIGAVLVLTVSGAKWLGSGRRSSSG